MAVVARSSFFWDLRRLAGGAEGTAAAGTAAAAGAVGAAAAAPSDCALMAGRLPWDLAYVWLGRHSKEGNESGKNEVEDRRVSPSEGSTRRRPAIVPF